MAERTFKKMASKSPLFISFDVPSVPFLQLEQIWELSSFR